MSTANLELAFCTVATANHIHYAQVLVQSLQATHAGVPVFVCLVDRPPDESGKLPVQSSPNVHWLYADALGIENWKRLAFQYSAFEMCCALKPRVIEHAMQRGHQRVIYLDADVYVYGPLSEIFLDSDRLSVGLTPHLSSPLPRDGKFPDERTILAAGAYNGGFIAVVDNDEGRAFLTWWKAHLADNCVVDLSHNLFVDQKWLDLVPSLFNCVRIHRRRGYHVAYWNLAGTTLKRSCSGSILLDNLPVGLIHFSGINIAEPTVVSKHQNRLTLDDDPVFAELLLRYIADLKAAGADDNAAWPYAFAQLRDETPIEPSWREVIRCRHPALDDLDDPFDTAAHPDLVERLQWAVEPPVVVEEPAEEPVIAQPPLLHRPFNAIRDALRRVRRLLGVSRSSFANSLSAAADGVGTDTHPTGNQRAA